MATVNIPSNKGRKPSKEARVDPAVERYEPDPDNPDSIWGWMSHETRATLDELSEWASINKGGYSTSGGIPEKIRDRRRSSKRASSSLRSRL